MKSLYPIVRLIVLTPDVDLTDIFYLKHIIGRLDFTDSGSVIPQLTVPKVRTLQIPVPPRNIQEQFAAEVEQLEAKITKAQAVIDKATERKNAILTKYLYREVGAIPNCPLYFFNITEFITLLIMKSHQ